jgi:hypothetical protein
MEPLQVRLALLALAAVLGWSCGGLHRYSPPAPAPLAHYSDRTLSFDHPASWRVSHYEVTSSFSATIVFLSTQPIHDPCSVRTASSLVCSLSLAEPTQTLKPGGVEVVWSEHDFPGWSFDRVQGQALVVDGHAARWQTQSEPQPDPHAPSTCSHMGGLESVQVIVLSSVPYRWYELDACFGPGDPASRERELHILLDSVRFKSPGA